MYKFLRYHLGAVKAFLDREVAVSEVTIRETGETLQSDFIIASNTRHVGQEVEIAPTAQLEDGLLNLTILKDVYYSTLVRFFLKLKQGEHMEDPAVETREVSHFSLQLHAGASATVDGDQVPYRKVDVTVLPSHLKTFI